MDFKQPSTNPLAKHFRQPSIYIKLPSQGNFWADGTLELPVTGEIPVLPMSTKDEITLRTPDALINGQGVVDAVQSCCPNIKDAWATPSIDIDSVLIGMRIASYGAGMDIESVCPHCSAENDFTVDLTKVLASVEVPDYSKKLAVDGLQIKLKPAPYFALNRANQIAFEEQQLLRSMSTIENNLEIVQEFNNRLARLIDLNVQTLTASTEHIETEDSSVVNNPEHIDEFYKNCDTKIIREVQSRVGELNNQAAIKPINVTCNSCNTPYDLGLTFDYASFFAVGS